MLQVGSPKYKVIKEKIDHNTFEGVTFEVTESMGLTFKVKHNAQSDEEAKAVLKKVISTIPEAKNVYTNIQYIDDQGHIL